MAKGSTCQKGADVCSRKPMRKKLPRRRNGKPEVGLLEVKNNPKENERSMENFGNGAQKVLNATINDNPLNGNGSNNGSNKELTATIKDGAAETKQNADGKRKKKKTNLFVEELTKQPQMEEIEEEPIIEEITFHDLFTLSAHQVDATLFKNLATVLKGNGVAVSYKSGKWTISFFFSDRFMVEKSFEFKGTNSLLNTLINGTRKFHSPIKRDMPTVTNELMDDDVSYLEELVAYLKTVDDELTIEKDGWNYIAKLKGHAVRDRNITLCLMGLGKGVEIK